MPVTQTVVYQKPGATFSSGEEAHQDKNSLYDPAFTESIEQCHAQMLVDGILLEPTSYTWDQETQQLTVRRVIRNNAEFTAARTYDIGAIVNNSTASGWNLISSDIS